ncbi:MAG: ABC transporter ATP-binding protein [Bacteroidetes bacterium]|nr:ABC transporter ATP-binding protein [bacterium]NBP63814.1 ABC transporter ATP-binding protein [Bacteroidota bacterium]
MDKSPIIEIRSLCKTFGQFRAVDNLDITVNQGDIYGFLGPNGAGKSTTIRMLLSLISPTSGNISVFGHSLLTHRNQILSGIGAIVEKPDFYLYLTAEQNINILAKLHGIDLGIKEIHRALDQVGLLDRAKSKVKTFSYGMKQRLGIAQALIHNPQLIILDEPTNGLDPVGVKEIRELILKLRSEQDKTIFLSSHILPEVELIANRMVIINKGSAVIEGSVNELLNSGMLTVNFSIDNIEKTKEVLRDSQFESSVLGFSEDSKLYIKLSKERITDCTSFLVDHGIGIDGISSTRSLEEYFLSITRP